ncbi:DUF2461 domain-containing protein [Streptomyces sp. H27-S2]|uniref:DUF2461 domain-containing protein n=1 Tax=Streptomyces antarcticus TaxID=2996458 RepID=UPI00226E5221|nr:DUF2461 domain-containing protein [Streptomyces sp. H27-S2]MCY0949323.1 DUF2461 domain-containing protein [Streptomyces sp. H27-S2]
MTFGGFPPSALRLYEDLADDNDRDSWRLRHRERYERDVRGPMDELAAELNGTFGESSGPGGVRVLGPVRDTRMSHDKSPYKTYQGAYLDLLPCLGLWVHLDRHGLYASGRYYPYAGAEVARYRAAVEEEDGGAELAAVVARLEAHGFTIGGDRLKSRPRGVPADHPRLDLLRHRKIDAGRRFGPDAGLHTARAADLVRETWLLVRPLLDWVAARDLTPRPREQGADQPS